MKLRTAIFFLFTLGLFLMAACGAQPEETTEMSFDEKQALYAEQIEAEDITKEDVEIVLIKELQDGNVSGYEEAVLFKCTATDHLSAAMCLSYATPETESVVIGGGAGPQLLDEQEPLNFSSVWARSQAEEQGALYLFYGLVHDAAIQEIELLFTDEVTISATVENGGFLLERVWDIPDPSAGIQKIAGKDAAGNVIYESPSREEL